MDWPCDKLLAMTETSLTSIREDEATPTRWSRFRFRFSIATLLLILVVMALAFSHCRLSQELHESQQQVDRLRRTYHLLLPGDPSKIQVLMQETNLEGEWQWRISFPDEGDEYEVICQIGEMPVNGSLPEAGNRLSLPAGEEFLVMVRLHRTANQLWTSTIVATLTHEMGFAFRRAQSPPISDEKVWWMRYEPVKFPTAPRGRLFKHPDRFGDRVFYFQNRGVFFSEQVGYSADKPLVLFEQRILDYDENGNPLKAIDPRDEMMIWIQRK